MKKNSNDCLYKNVCTNSKSKCASCKHKFDTVINDDLYNAFKKDCNKANEDVDEGLKNAIMASKRKR